MRICRAGRVVSGMVAAFLLVGAFPGLARSQTFLTQEQALARAFPEARQVDRRTAYLDDASLRRARALAGKAAEIESGVVTYYVGRAEDGSALGVTYFDVHRVRTLSEVLMVVVGPDDAVRRIEVLRFSEPREYLAPDGWLQQFVGRHLSPDRSTGEGVVAITGATLTSRAVTAAVRRVLALNRVIDPLHQRAG